MKNPTTAERKSERELVVTRTFNGPARIVFEAWTKPELFKQWWVPKSFGLSMLSCEMDVRVGGGYRLEFSHPAAPKPMEFFGRYLEVTPHSRLAWTKPELFKRWWAPKSMGMSLRSCEMDVRVGGKYRLEFEHDAMAFFGTYLEVTPHSRLVWTNEEGGEGGNVTTVTFEEKGGKTLLVMHELYPSKEALDAAGTGAADATVETFAQLDELLLTLGASVGRS